MKTKTHPPKTDPVQAAILAATALLDRIDGITTDEFERGGERAEREALRAALAALRACAENKETPYQVGQRVRRYKSLGTVIAICAEAVNGYIVQMDRDEPGAVIMAAGYLLRPAA